MESRIKESVLNLVIDRDQSFLKTARRQKTSIVVNNRVGKIEEFNHGGRRYISFPSSMEAELQALDDAGEDSETRLDSYLKVATAGLEDMVEPYEELTMDKFFEDKKDLYKDITGLDAGFTKEEENIFSYRASKADKTPEEEKKDKEDAEEGEEGNTSSKLSSKGMTQESVYEKVEIAQGTEQAREYSWEDTDLSLDSPLTDELRSNKFHGESKIKNNHRELKLRALANQIAKSFKGRISKLKTMSPSKRMDTKNLSADISEKIYINKKGNNGKHLHVNLIIDMSGSMSGTPVKNAVEMIYIFNELAALGYLTGSVMWSESSSRCKAPFPMPREMVKRMTSTGGAEGLGQNLQHFKKELKEADTNICMTDGSLCDDPILTELYKKEKIEIIGVYVNEDAKDLTEYTGSLKRWFTRSIVRHTVEELCEKLIQFSLRKKGK